MLLLSELTLYYCDLTWSLKTSSNLKHPNSNHEGIISNWADKVASKPQLKPSAPPSARSLISTHRPGQEDLDFDDASEEEYYDVPPGTQAKGVSAYSNLSPHPLILATGRMLCILS